MFRLAGKAKEDVVGQRPTGGDTGLVSVKRRDFVLTPSSLTTSIPFIHSHVC